MRLLAISILSIFITSFALLNPAKVKIKIYVLDETSELVSGAKVSLYGSFENYKKEVKPLFSAVTNEKGYVQFKELKEMNYYIHVTKGDLNNNGGNVETDELHVKGKNRFEVTID